MKEVNKSRFEDIITPKICNDPSHNPPNMLLVPAGKVYIHVCPSCGLESKVYGQLVIT